MLKRLGKTETWLRKARQFADSDSGYSQEHLRRLFRLLREHRPVFGVSHVGILVTVSWADGREEPQRLSITENCSKDRLEAEIPSPGLAAPGSQLAVPIMARNRTLGVLCLEDAEESKFGYDEEDAVVSMAQHLGLAAHILGQSGDGAERPRNKAAREPAPPCVCRSPTSASGRRP